MASAPSARARLATAAGGARTLAREAARAAGYAARTFGSPGGLRGMAVESAWLVAHVASYPLGLIAETMQDPDHYRTDVLPPRMRSLVVSDVAAAGTPIILVHGIMDNRSVFSVFGRALRRRGFGRVHAVNYGVLTGDLRDAARELRRAVEDVRASTGAEKVHIVGHSLGGMIARYYVQRMGGDEAVDTLVTLGSPHTGTATAYLMPTPLARQLRPGSEVLTELAGPASRCRTRFLVVWSRLDEMVVPQGNARLTHPDLWVEELELRDVGHLSLPIDPRTVHWVATALARSDARTDHFTRRSRSRRATNATMRDRSSPA
ncbi:alpha/beta hydrolase fold protein [Pseudonocardia dioxanivorans CB1190]|uniref:Alpha/beta hydrolase fold protein n=1 Tax=Pseudonocardia dioxanivorans (strain ATCC 55486 / DSM 44775 / JCM 13855 / CB1190) TaxID=675635 RepID=F4CUZ8_PSEUX|nr:alpha/beta fold hydrolase [Pseudonocardia dioxanivorans]AEA27467.1 alpha/beta hydrolase fold protein [Pseudonocardia dioxanivorans CB1190]